MDALNRRQEVAVECSGEPLKRAGWSPDDRTMYFTDFGRRVIYAYDFDADTARFQNAGRRSNSAGRGFPRQHDNRRRSAFGSRVGTGGGHALWADGEPQQTN